MFLMPNQHMLLPPANIFVAAADLGIGGPNPQLASEPIKYGAIVSVRMSDRGRSQNKTQAKTKNTDVTHNGRVVSAFVLTA